jgi:hypothetical protein
MKNKSKFLRLNRRDFLKGLIVAIISAIITSISQTAGSGINPEEIGAIAIVAGASYLSKNLIENSRGDIKTERQE